MNIVFLPATEPNDKTYGTVPDRIKADPTASIHHVHYPTMVWYNEAVRREAIAQIRALGTSPITLIGFSKSGLGAWNIARALPDHVVCTIIFDAPVARDVLPPWGTAPFYENDEAWQADLPLRTIPAFQAVMPKEHLLVLISGANFDDEMGTLSQELVKRGVPHVFLPRPDFKHHWQSGWIEAGLNAIVTHGLAL